MKEQSRRRKSVEVEKEWGMRILIQCLTPTRERGRRNGWNSRPADVVVAAAAQWSGVKLLEPEEGLV